MADTQKEIIGDDAKRKKEINKRYNEKFKHLSLRVQPNDYKKLESNAHKLGFVTKTGKTNVTNYVLNRSLKEDKELIKELEDYKKIQFQVRKIGVNLNQLTKRMNQLSGSTSNAELKTQLGLIRNDLKTILSKL